MPSNHKPSHTTHSHRGRPSAGSSSGRQRQNKLRELLSMGIPRRLAQQVASGHRDLSDILQEMARHEKVDKLVAEHDLPRSLAVQCVLGQADLKAYLSKRRRHEYRSEHGWRSVFQEAHQDAEPRTFAVLGRANRHVQVQAVDRYELDVVDANGGEPEKLHKQQVKLVYRVEDRKVVRKALGRDKAYKDVVAEPVWRIQDRYHCPDKMLFPWLENGTRVQFVTVEGERIQGVVTWYSRYEITFEVRGGAIVTALRHSLAEVRQV